jgi:glucosamine--fructose-6-phosphate aminotransferase (isomerizing)
MCSVVGYLGKQLCRKSIIEGLRRLEYRGYDSAGFACISPQNSRLLYAKAVGRLESLEAKLLNDPIDGHIGIGHTRWSTHGAVTENNAHPHFDCNKSVAVVHNGIIENCFQIKGQLEEAGHIFFSNTDTEVIAHQLEELLPSRITLKKAIVDLVAMLEGAYAFLVMMEKSPDCLVAVRKRSPLCIGIGQDELFVASDPLAFAGSTSKVCFLPDESFAIIKADQIELFNFKGEVLPIEVQELTIDWVNQERHGHEHYMLKEICEQKEVIHATVDFLRHISSDVWSYMGLSVEQAKALESIHMIGCGTSAHAAHIGTFFFEYATRIPAYVHVASEFRYRPFFPSSNALYIAVSQSGETADTLEAMRMLQRYDMPTVALSNVASSTMVREAGGFLLTQAGYEIAVVSTKAFSAQLVVLYWLAHRIALEKRLISIEELHTAEEDLLVVAQILESCMENYRLNIAHIVAKEYAQYQNFIFLGRHESYPFAQEAALKLKETSYRYTLCYAAGELKHGPLALIDSTTPVVVFSSQDPIIYSKLLGNVQEVKARGGHIVAFAYEHQKELHALADRVFTIPCTKPLLGTIAMTGIMQLFVYQIAKELGRPIDKPRNLAKSVTVE